MKLEKRKEDTKKCREIIGELLDTSPNEFKKKTTENVKGEGRKINFLKY